MHEEIRMGLEQLKQKKLTAQKIEIALGFANGLLGKVAKGKTNLSPERFLKFIDFAKTNGVDIPIQSKSEEEKEVEKSVKKVFTENKDVLKKVANDIFTTGSGGVKIIKGEKARALTLDERIAILDAEEKRKGKAPDPMPDPKKQPNEYRQWIHRQNSK